MFTGTIVNAGATVRVAGSGSGCGGAGLVGCGGSGADEGVESGIWAGAEGCAGVDGCTGTYGCAGAEGCAGVDGCAGADGGAGTDGCAGVSGTRNVGIDDGTWTEGVESEGEGWMIGTSPGNSP